MQEIAIGMIIYTGRASIPKNYWPVSVLFQSQNEPPQKVQKVQKEIDCHSATNQPNRPQSPVFLPFPPSPRPRWCLLKVVLVSIYRREFKKTLGLGLGLMKTHGVKEHKPSLAWGQTILRKDQSTSTQRPGQNIISWSMQRFLSRYNMGLYSGEKGGN